MITIKRDGCWRVELTTPIRQASGPDIEVIDIRPMDFDLIIRWQGGEFPSKLALLAVVCNIREIYLRQLQGIDVDRVMLAFVNSVPATVQAGLQNAEVPLATPSQDMFSDRPIGEVVRNEDTFVNDPVDPRFPRADGPVNRFSEPSNEQPPTPAQSADSLHVGPRDEIMKVVGA